MRVMKFISVAVGVAMLLTLASAQQAATAPSTPTVKHVPSMRAPVNSGKDMFNSYCAVCHGTDAKGAGPAASAMKTNPADLTALAKKSGGKYPASHVATVLRGQSITASHGSQDMPVWGPLFSSISQGHEAQVQQRIANLVDYVETLQTK
jgi:mono/diheme cytochrome c family protein